MARSRSTKRNSSSSSYASTITTVIFIALCVIGVWMLTSNSIVSPESTTRTSKPVSATTNIAAERDVEVQNTETSNKNDNTETGNKNDTSVYEDNPGDLPEDAIKSDEQGGNGNDSKEQTNNGKQETAAGDGTNLKGQESREEKEKQEEGQNQISEESPITQNQQAEQTSQESSKSEGNQETKNEEPETSANANQQQSDQVSDQDPNTSQESQNQNQVQQQEQQKEVRESSEESLDSNRKEEQQQQQQKEEFEVSKDPRIPALNEDQQQQQGNGSITENNQIEKSYEEQQQEQRHEDAGIQSSLQESKNELSEEDQQRRMQQHQQQKQQQDKQTSNDQETQRDKSQETQRDTSQETKQNTSQETKQDTDMGNNDATGSNTGESSFPGGGNSGIPKESKESKKSWSTQATESENQKDRRKEESDGNESTYGYTWQICNVTAGPDYIPCLDNEKALRQLRTTGHFEHRERHCPEVGPTCLVPLPDGYKRPITWPQSRDKIWYHNVPHTKLAEVKGHQNWVKVTGEFLTFPGGGTQFIHGALHYIDFLQQAVPNIKWGKRTRVILDVGCGVASFGGYLFEKDVLAMSFAPKDEHEAQVQFALERGIPAISAVMGSQRLPFPSRVFDVVHCARCRVPWHNEGGLLLLELNRVLRPGGYFVWSATPVYQKLEEDVKIWQAMSALTVSMCWDLVTIKKDKLNSIGAAIYRKPVSNDCYDQRKKNSPPMCSNDDDANAAWYVPLQACMHRVPVRKTERGTRWPDDWPQRLQTPPYWLNSSQMGIYGKPAPQDFSTDYEHWKHVVTSSYMKGLGISWSNVRNVMDMRAVYGGFAAALKDLKVWVLNVVNVDSPDTLPIMYERGLFGIYHDWCESFSTYPRTYDLLHADHLFSKLKKRCKLVPVLAEVDRIMRPGGKLIVRDESSAIGEVENLLKSLHWEVHLTFSKDQEGILSAQKGDWRPQTYAASS